MYGNGTAPIIGVKKTLVIHLHGQGVSFTAPPLNCPKNPWTLQWRGERTWTTEEFLVLLMTALWGVLDVSCCQESRQSLRDHLLHVIEGRWVVDRPSSEPNKRHRYHRWVDCGLANRGHVCFQRCCLQISKEAFSFIKLWMDGLDGCRCKTCTSKAAFCHAKLAWGAPLATAAFCLSDSWL